MNLLNGVSFLYFHSSVHSSNWRGREHAGHKVSILSLNSDYFRLFPIIIDEGSFDIPGDLGTPVRTQTQKIFRLFPISLLLLFNLKNFFAYFRLSPISLLLLSKLKRSFAYFRCFCLFPCQPQTPTSVKPRCKEINE